MDKNPTLSLFTKALQFASFKHSSQRRKNGDIPYINHPIEVANILCSAGIEDYNVLCAAILHDTVEDTETTAEELQKQFGGKIKDIVLQCSDDKDLSKVERKKQQIVHAGTISVEAKLVKIGDKLSNNRDLLKKPPPKWSEQRVKGYYLWSYMVCKQLFGINENLDKQMTDLFTQTGTIKEVSEGDIETKINEYYKTL